MNVSNAIMMPDGIDDREGNPPSGSWWPYYAGWSGSGEAYGFDL